MVSVRRIKRKNKKTQTKKTKAASGFTIIEALVLLFIFSVVVITFYQVLSAGTLYIMDSKTRLGAVSLANERMEMVRNLAYKDIGTIGGEIDGNIPQIQDVIENGKPYSIETEVSYAHDTYDGEFPPNDVAFEDYKIVKIIVSWATGSSVARSVELVSRFVPPGLEVVNPEDGILSINIFSDQPGGVGIPESKVHVVNTETGLDVTKPTGSTGNVILMGDNVTNSIQKYVIRVEKIGYETVDTMPPYPLSLYYPIDVHASVVAGSMNVINIVQNKLSNLKINTVDYLGGDIANIGFHIAGGRKLGVGETYPSDPVYNLDEDGTTDSSGEKDYPGVSPGNYEVSILPSVIEYELIDTDPPNPFSLMSDNPLTCKMRLASKNATSLLVKVLKVDGSGTVPVSGAQVELTNGSDYSATQSSAYNGAAFFPVTADLFSAGSYNLKITADGFHENNSAVTVSENQLKIETITLAPL